MALTDYSEATATIPVGNTVLTLRPISPEGLGALLEVHGERFRSVLPNFAPMLQSGVPEQIQYGVIGIFTGLADLVAHAICISAREPDAFEIAKRLPLMESIKAAVTILGLSGLGLPAAAISQINDLLNVPTSSVN